MDEERTYSVLEVAELMAVRPVQNEGGTWDALDGLGHGHVLDCATEAECAAWIAGYGVGARENM